MLNCRSLSDINECTNGTHTCDANAACTNTNGSYTCQCHSGYYQSGKKCNGKARCGEIFEADVYTCKEKSYSTSPKLDSITF